jgi:hypothetical protein
LDLNPVAKNLDPDVQDCKNTDKYHKVRNPGSAIAYLARRVEKSSSSLLRSTDSLLEITLLTVLLA